MKGYKHSPVVHHHINWVEFNLGSTYSIYLFSFCSYFRSFRRFWTLFLLFAYFSGYCLTWRFTLQTAPFFLLKSIVSTWFMLTKEISYSWAPRRRPRVDPPLSGGTGVALRRRRHRAFSSGGTDGLQRPNCDFVLRRQRLVAIGIDASVVGPHSRRHGKLLSHGRDVQVG